MPAMVWRTTPAPLVAICTERCATSADSAELRDTWSMLAAISLMRLGRGVDLLRLVLGRFGQVHRGGLGFLRAGRATCTEVSLIVVTRLRSCSTAKLIESAIAPVMSSVTVAFTVRSPSRERTHFVQQAHDRLLVAVVEFLGGLVTGALRAAQGPQQAGDREQRQGTGKDAEPDATDDAGVLQRAERGECREQVFAVGQQLVGAGGHCSQPKSARRSGPCELATIASRSFFMSCQRVLAWLSGPSAPAAADLGDVATTIAQCVHRPIEHRRVAPQRTGRHLRATATRLQFGDAACHGGGCHHLLQRREHLAGTSRRRRTGREPLRSTAPATAAPCW